MMLSPAFSKAADLLFAPLVKGGDKARERLVGDLLFAPRANPPSSAVRMPAPFCKGGNTLGLLAAMVVGVPN